MNELEAIVKHFTELYAEEIENNEVTGDVIDEWWVMTKDQYSFDDYDAVEKAIFKAINN